MEVVYMSMSYKDDGSLVTREDKRKISDEVTLTVRREQCSVERAISLVKERMHVQKVCPSAVRKWIEGFGIDLRKQLNCYTCGLPFKAQHPNTKSCPSCKKKHTPHALEYARKNNVPVESICASEDILTCDTCHLEFSYGGKGSKKKCPNCLNNLLASHKSVQQYKQVGECPACGRFKYVYGQHHRQKVKYSHCCTECSDNYTYKEKTWRSRLRRYGKIFMCLCGNQVRRVKAKEGRNTPCDRCKKYLTVTQRYTWRIANYYTRCAYCYSKISINTGSRFCEDCLSIHDEQTLTKLCMTEEMKEEEEVKRHNKEFMRKHTRMMNRNKPKKQTKQQTKTNYQEKLIDDMRDLAIIESLKSLIEE